MICNAETVEQIIVIEFVKQIARVPVMHIAGERKCSPQYGAMLKRMGTIPGVADLFFPRGNEFQKGLWIEMKTLVGKPTALQLQFLADMRKEGYQAIVAHGSKEAINIICDFYNLPEWKKS